MKKTEVKKTEVKKPKIRETKKEQAAWTGSMEPNTGVT